MNEGVKEIFLGIFVVFLALLLWRATHNVWGWLVFFIPGTGYIVFGLVKVIRDRY